MAAFHCVMFQLVDASSAPQVVQILRGMEGKLETLLSIEVGTDVTRNPERSFDVFLRTEHASWDGYVAYRDHPLHQEVLKALKPLVQRSVAVDYDG